MLFYVCFGVGCQLPLYHCVHSRQYTTLPMCLLLCYVTLWIALVATSVVYSEHDNGHLACLQIEYAVSLDVSDQAAIDAHHCLTEGKPRNEKTEK